jgi:hypothetical protein
MSTWEQQIEQDLQWREAEIASLKLLAAGAESNSDRQRALLRASSAMLYAHYEGFCKFCWDLLLDTIEGAGCPRRDLVEPAAIVSLASVFKNFRGDTSDEKIWEFVTKDFTDCMNELAAFPRKLETKSNLWPNLARQNNSSVGLNCPLFVEKEAKLKQLVGYRNEIAHGKKLIIKDLTQFQEFEDAALLVMHDLALAVVACLSSRNYLKSITSSVTMASAERAL